MSVPQHVVTVGSVSIGNTLPFVFIGGPDSIESYDHAVYMATEIKAICATLEIPFIFKACFDKANRTSVSSFRGVGLEEGLSILQKIREQVGVPITTDIHAPEQAAPVAAVIDLIQIPALLSRQTDLLLAAGATKKPVNIKKGQFMAPHDVGGPVEKVRRGGSEQVLITERGYMFGYHNLVVDMRGLHIMKERTGQPIILDASHPVQLPSADGNKSGGEREFIPVLARAGIAVGIAGVFMEVHDNPDAAPVDGPNSLRLSDLASVLQTLQSIDRAVKDV